MYANKRAHSICFYRSLIIGPRKLHCRALRSFRKDHSSREDRTATHVRTGKSPALVQQKSSFGLRGNGIFAFYRKREPVCQLRKSMILPRSRSCIGCGCFRWNGLVREEKNLALSQSHRPAEDFLRPFYDFFGIKGSGMRFRGIRH